MDLSIPNSRLITFSTECRCVVPCTRPGTGLSDKMYQLISFRKSTPSQHCQLNVVISNRKQSVGPCTCRKVHHTPESRKRTIQGPSVKLCTSSPSPGCSSTPALTLHVSGEMCNSNGNNLLQGYLAHKKQPTSPDHHRALNIALLQGPRSALFLMSEVPL